MADTLIGHTKSIKANQVNWSFLLFLILITQGNLFIKPLGVVVILLGSRHLPIKFDVRSMGMFHFIMVVYAALSGLTLFFDFNRDYAIIVFLGVMFWLLGLIIFQYLQHFITRANLSVIHNTLQAYFYINALVCAYQLFQLFIVFDFSNPFANQASGDYMRGFFANSSVNFIVCAFFKFYFFYQKQYYKMILAGVLALMTTYMSGLLILLLVTGYFVFTSSSIKWVHRFTLILLGILFLAVVWVASRTNFIYAMDAISAISSNNKPRKIVSFVQTYDYLMESPSNFLVGSGVGNFSSRLAFIADGEYVAWYPREFIYRSKDFTQNHYTLWNANLIFDRTQRGTSNQPFSIYNQMLGEYGMIGFFILMFYYFGYALRNYRKLTYGKILLFLLAGFFVLDYWFEYFSITIIAEMLFLLNVRSYHALADKT